MSHGYKMRTNGEDYSKVVNEQPFKNKFKMVFKDPQKKPKYKVDKITKPKNEEVRANMLMIFYQF